jgi:outer membrane protein TolC
MAPDSATCVYHTTDLSIQLHQPLLRGLGPAFAERDVRHGNIARSIAYLNRQARAAIVVRDVVTAYWVLALSSNSVAIQRSAVELAREQLRATESQIAVGKRAPLDAAATEQAISNRVIAVELAEQEALVHPRAAQPDGPRWQPTFPSYTAAELPPAALAELDDADLARAHR